MLFLLGARSARDDEPPLLLPPGAFSDDGAGESDGEARSETPVAGCARPEAGGRPWPTLKGQYPPTPTRRTQERLQASVGPELKK